MQFFGGSLVANVSPSPATMPTCSTSSIGAASASFTANGIGPTAPSTQKRTRNSCSVSSSPSDPSPPRWIPLAGIKAPLLPDQGCSFYSFRTNTYKLSFMESPSGIKEEDLCMENIYYSEIKDAGFFDDDWD